MTRFGSTIAMGGDNFVGGLGSAAFVAYLSALCNIAFTATQYALLSSFMAVGRTLLSSGSGWLAQQIELGRLLHRLRRLWRFRGCCCFSG